MIKQILVTEGDRVEKDDVVAILDNQPQRLADLTSYRASVAAAQAKLNKVIAGAKAGDINAQRERVSRLEADLNGQIDTQRATIASITAELRNAEIEARRYQQLHNEGAVSTAERDSKQLIEETAQERLNEAQAALSRTIATTQRQRREAEATLASVSEVRDVDVQLAQAELEQAQAGVARAQADLDAAYITAPIDGQILKVHVQPGETIGAEGIVEIGQTDRMMAIAQIYETDIAKVSIGQNAIVTSNSFFEKLQGKVTQIGLMVEQQDLFVTNPTAETDNRIIEVKIRLDEAASDHTKKLTGLQVEIVIYDDAK